MVEVKDFKVGSVFMLCGAVVGAGLGLLFAPRSGGEMRKMLQAQAHDAQHSAQELGARMKTSFGEMMDKAQGFLPEKKMV